MEHGPSLALPPPEEDAARASAEEAGKVKEREGVEKDEKEEKGLMTPTRSTTGPPGSATGPTTEMEVFRSGGSKPSAKGSTEHPKGRPVTLAPLVPLQQQMAPLFTKEQLKESRAAARMAPQVFGKPPPPSSSEEQVELLQRPAFLQEEEERFGGKKRAPGGYEEDESEELRRCDDEDSEGAQGRRRSRLQEEQEEEIMWRWQISQDMKKLTSLCQDQQRENDRLQQELYEWRLEDAERRKQEEDKKKKKDKEEGHAPRSSSTFNTPEEAKPEAPSVLEMLGGRGRTPWSTYPARYGKGSRSQSKDPPRKGRSPSYGKGFKEDPRSTAQKPTMGGAKPSPEIQQMEVMALLVESMKALQRQISEGHESQGTIKGVEVVRQVAELPALGSIQGSTSQLQLGDWLLLVQPVVADLTATSDLWWEKMMLEVERWYQDHQAMPPLDRVQHEPVAPASLNVPKWTKLERRMATLLLKAIPEGQRDELVATKRLSVFAILAHLHLSYCPGGVSEKQMLLRNLEEPNEPSNLHETVVSLRRWLRWRARAQEIGATEPDPSILVKGLNKLTKRTLEANEGLRFRVSLARNSLQVDTNPTPVSVSQFATHLIAEIDQLALAEKRSAGAGGGKKEDAKVKKLDEGGMKKGKNVEVKVKEMEVKQPCKFFLTDSGCRRGKDCRWSHDLKDDQRRCYSCGSTKHLAPNCPTKDPVSPTSSTSPPKVKKEKEDEKGRKEDDEKSAGGTEGEKMDELLEEANKMLRMMKDKETSEAKMNKLHQQLDEIKRSIKTLKLTKVREAKVGSKKEEEWGLLDSGATHPLRPLALTDCVDSLKKVSVSLADGRTTPLLMTEAGVMISTNLAVEPIVPLGILAGCGCSISWKKNGMKVTHPKKGPLPISIQAGCPQIPKALALELIKEYEERVTDVKQARLVEETHPKREVEWLSSLVEGHPTLSMLPDSIKKSLIQQPGEWKDLPVNRHQRKRLKAAGPIILHLYAGEKDGFTLHKAMEEYGLGSRTLEVDLKRGEEHDMASMDSKAYKGMLRLALDGDLAAIVGGPNCRSRSVLRHYPGGPRPVRSWEEPWGTSQLNEEELNMCLEDDIMMWRQIFLYLVAEMSRKLQEASANESSRVRNHEVLFLLEQPSDPVDYKPECVSFWRTKEWLSLKAAAKLDLHQVNQGDFEPWKNEVPVKPTSLAANFSLRLPKGRNPGARSRSEGQKLPSASLSRWVPGLCRAIAEACALHLHEGDEEKMKIKAMTWDQHCQNGHVPFRRDCRVCQEQSAKSKPHRKVKHPLAATLSLDTAGPYPVAQDGRDVAKFIMVGTYTWLLPADYELPEELVSAEDEDFSEVQLQEEKDDEVNGEGQDDPDDQIEQDEVPAEEVEEREDGEEGQEDEEQGEKKEEPRLVTFRLAIPMPSKDQKMVLSTIQQMYIQLRVMGYHVARLHTDLGGEFRGRSLTQWCRSRDIHRTTTAGVSSQSNGRAERAIQTVKGQIRRLLGMAGLPASRWPQACHYVHERERRRMADKELNDVPPFGHELLVKRRFWKTKELEGTHEVVKYLAPRPDAHGHLVLRQDGRTAIAPYFITKTKEPEPSQWTWLAITKAMDEEEDPHEVRRRIRGKVTAKSMKKDEYEEMEEERKRDLERLSNVVLEESVIMLKDEVKVMDIVYEELKKVKSAMPKEEESVLRTRIVSPKELLSEAPKWDEAIKKELHQLFEEKQALKRISEDEVERLRKRWGRHLEILPSKVVITLKPGPRRKIRLVACGNFVDQSTPDQKDQCLYASGADAVCLRYVLKQAAEKSWGATVLDIRTAFLNAPLDVEDDGQDPTVVVLKPPSLLIKTGHVGVKEFYLAQKAMYGLRQSPRCWGLHRDGVLRKMKSKEGHRFVQAEAEPNLWSIMKGQGNDDDRDEWLVGFLLVYVDDLMVASDPTTTSLIVQMLQDEWETSEPEVVGQKKVKFLGMELTQAPQGGFRASQEDYILDKEGIPEGRSVKVPMTKDALPYPEEPTAEKITEAQKLVGELMWLSTRTRPDVSFATSRCAQEILTHPTWASEQAIQVWKYLKNTPKEGLEFRPGRGEGWDGGPRSLEVYTDSSFAATPETQASHGAVMVLWNGAMMFWKSGKQPFPALSTAESELLEAIEGLQTGDAVDSMIQEHEDPYTKTLFVDNLAATGFFADGHANWRTRHLRLRAQHVRWRITNLDWRVRHLPGAIMIADLGTKPLPIQRTLELKELMSMAIQKKVEEEKKEVKEDGPEAARVQKEVKEDGPEAARSKKEEYTQKKVEEEKKEEKERPKKEGRSGLQINANQMQLAVLMAIIAKARAQGGGDEKGQPSDEGPLKFLVLGYTLLVVLATLYLRRFIAWLCEPAVPGGDHAAGIPEDPPVRGPPGSTSSEPSQGSSITVDWQGREVNRPSARSKGKRKGKGQGKGEQTEIDWAYGASRPMTQEERSQFGIQNREWLIRWMSSLSPEERVMAGLEQPLMGSGSSGPASMATSSNTDPNLGGIQEEPEQEVPAEAEPDGPEAMEVEEEVTLHHPTERDYRDIRLDESWEPSDDPPTAAPKAAPRRFQQAGSAGGKSEGGSEGGKGEGKGRDTVGVFITKFGQRYHLFESCQSLQTSILRSSPPCHRCAYCSEQSRLRRGEPIWCRGWGEIYHRNAPSPLPCSTGSEKKYDQCTLCSQELRRRGLNL